MSSQSKICGTCDEKYTHDGEKGPVILPLCGHTYYRSSLKVIETKCVKKNLCPFSRSDWRHMRSQELPVCLQLLPRVERNNDIGHISPRGNGHMTEVDERPKIKQILEQHYKKLSFQMQSVNSGHVETMDRIRTVDIIIKDVSVYRKLLESHQVDLKERKKLLEQQLEKVRKALSSPKEFEEDINFPKKSYPPKNSFNGTSEVPAIPVCRAWFVVEIFEACKMEPNERILETTLKRLLEQRFQSRILKELPLSQSTCDDGPLMDNGHWAIDSDKKGSKAIVTLTDTSSRPTSVTISVSTEWNRSTLLNLLRTIASRSCSVALIFEDTFQNPSSENNGITWKRLNCLDVTNRRCQLTEYKGSINTEVSTILLKLKSKEEFSIQCRVTSADEIDAVQRVSATMTIIDIPREVESGILSSLRNTGCCKLLLHGRGDEDLYEISTQFHRLCEGVIALPIQLLESSITEGGLDRYLGYMRDHEFPSVKCRTINYRHMSQTLFEIQSKLLDQTRRQEIDNKLQMCKRTNFIKWYTN